MSEISMFMLFDSITITPQGPQLISPQAILRPTFIPGNFSFALALSIAGVKTSIAHTFYFYIQNPKGETIHEAPMQNLPLDPSASKSNIPEKDQGFVIAIDIRNLPITEEGEYQFFISIDNTDILSKTFSVYRKESK